MSGAEDLGRWLLLALVGLIAITFIIVNGPNFRAPGYVYTVFIFVAIAGVISFPLIRKAVYGG